MKEDVESSLGNTREGWNGRMAKLKWEEMNEMKKGDL